MYREEITLNTIRTGIIIFIDALRSNENHADDQLVLFNLFVLLKSSVWKVKTKRLIATTWMKSPLDQQKFDWALKTRMFHPETRDSAVLLRDQRTAGDSGYDCLGYSKEFPSVLSTRPAQSNYHRPARLVFVPPLLLQSGCANSARWWHAVKCGSGRRCVGRRQFFSQFVGLFWFQPPRLAATFNRFILVQLYTRAVAKI